MQSPRALPLFDTLSGDRGASRSSWNERMAEGEYAVHYSSFEHATGTAPYCTVLSSLKEAEEFAEREVARRPELRCTIYDHQGLVGPPLRDIRGSAYKGPSEITPRFRLWVGSVLFFGGVALTLLDWSTDFRLSWPAMIGTRMVLPGLLLLFIEAMVRLHAKQSRLARQKDGAGLAK